MTRGLFIFCNCFFILIMLLVLVIIRIYACFKMKKLYDELNLGHVNDAFGYCQAYARKYVEVIAFRKRFYPFLSYYLKEVRFKTFHDYCETFYPDFARKIDSLYSR